jgi:hypothetical protein
MASKKTFLLRSMHQFWEFVLHVKKKKGESVCVKYEGLRCCNLGAAVPDFAARFGKLKALSR